MNTVVMKSILNSSPSTSFLEHIRQLSMSGTSLKIAVSYLQHSGIEALINAIQPMPHTEVTILFTDQLFITQPAAIIYALKRDLIIRRYTGKKIFHPKLYLALNPKNECKAAIIGSANLSLSAMNESVEAGIFVQHDPVLSEYSHFFDDLILNHSQEINLESEWLAQYSTSWNDQLRTKIFNLPPPTNQGRNKKITEITSDIFTGLNDPIGNLGFDHARNNIRTLSLCLDRLRQGDFQGKTKSELRLLGLIDDVGQFTKIGESALMSQDQNQLAKIWCQWVKTEHDFVLNDINPRILSFKKAVTQFWELKQEVRDYYFANEGTKDESIIWELIAIEVLVNTQDASPFDLVTVKSMALIIESYESFSSDNLEIMVEYIKNKGKRSWKNNPDRWIMPSVWKQTK